MTSISIFLLNSADAVTAALEIDIGTSGLYATEYEPFEVVATLVGFIGTFIK